jgi:acetoin utilization protein AcuC
MKDMIIVHSDEYENWIFDPTHPTQGRRFIKGYDSIIMHAESNLYSHETRQPRIATRTELTTVHTENYVDEVTNAFLSGEWQGQQPDLAHLSQLFVGGTLTALQALRDGETLLAVNLPGAKHHAQADHSSGFCVFGDFAIAAKTLTKDKERVAILDIDVHHGDGTENLTRDDERVLTYSIHQINIFPGTGLKDEPDKHVYNYPLHSGDGDRSLRQGVLDFIDQAEHFLPDYIFIAGGADGHWTDPLGNLKYTMNGYEDALRLVRQRFPYTPILFGGAGGYNPDGSTPLAWARMVNALIY